MMKNWKRRIGLLLVFCMVLSLFPLGVFASAIVPHTGTVGEGGAPWRLYSDGTLKVDEGFIQWIGGAWLEVSQSPWHEYRHSIDRIIFTGPIMGGASLMGLFAQLPNVATIEGLHYFDTSNVKNMSGVFFRADSLGRLDLSVWDTSNVTTMSGMFSGALSLSDLDVSHFDTSNVTTMSSMFSSSGLERLDLSSWNTSSVTNMGHMFSRALSLSDLDVSHFDTSNVTTMSSMFSSSGLERLDLSSWDTSNVTTMSGMFSHTFSLNDLDVSHFDTSNVTNMSYMFVQTGLTSLDLSGWDIRNVTNMRSMFSQANSLRQIVLGEHFIFSLSHAPGIWQPDEPPPYIDARLTPPPQNDDYTGYWQNVGPGTVYDPQGEFVFTATELMENYDGSTMADIWVWQPRNPGPPPPNFNDVSSDSWYHPYIQFVARNNLMLGTGDGRFSPHTPLNRAMLATILWRMAGEPETEFRPVFSDVPSDAPAWYRTAVIWANENDIVRGFDGRFDPYGEVTREAFAAKLYRYAQFAGISTSIPDGFDLDNFRDRDEISAWAEAYMVWAVYEGLIRGVGAEMLAPGGTATRAEGAAILTRFMQRVAE